MEKLQLTPDDVWTESQKLEENLFQAMAKLQARTEHVVSELKKGDAKISRANVFTDWAKESCAQISA